MAYHYVELVNREDGSLVPAAIDLPVRRISSVLRIESDVYIALYNVLLSPGTARHFHEVEQWETPIHVIPRAKLRTVIYDLWEEGRLIFDDRMERGDCLPHGPRAQFLSVSIDDLLVLKQCPVRRIDNISHPVFSRNTAISFMAWVIGEGIAGRAKEVAEGN